LVGTNGLEKEKENCFIYNDVQGIALMDITGNLKIKSVG